MNVQTLQKRYVRVYRKKCKIAKCEEDKDAKVAVEVVAKAITMLSPSDKSKWIASLYEELKEKLTEMATKDECEDPRTKATDMCRRVPDAVLIAICQMEFIMKQKNDW